MINRNDLSPVKISTKGDSMKHASVRTSLTTTLLICGLLFTAAPALPADSPAPATTNGPAAPAGNEATKAVSRNEPPAAPTKSTPATAPVALDAMALFEAQRYPAALAAFKARVELNPDDAQALYMIGLCHENGFGTGKDPLAASAWYRQAWRAGSKEAHSRLTALYLNTVEPPVPQSAASSLVHGSANKGLASGGTLSALQGDLSPGHNEVTIKVLSAVGFSRNAISITSDASQDPDLYDWGVPAAHAQTRNDAEGRTSESESEAIANFQTWMKDLVRRMMNESHDNPKGALYLLGYLLHGIQDLASHKGITDAQHSYETYSAGRDHDSDHERANVALASAFSQRFMEKLRTQQPDNFKSLATYGSGIAIMGETLSLSEKSAIMRKSGMNFSLESFKEYEHLAKKYEKIKEQYPKKPWPVEQIFSGMLEWL